MQLIGNKKRVRICKLSSLTSLGLSDASVSYLRSKRTSKICEVPATLTPFMVSTARLASPASWNLISLDFHENELSVAVDR